MSREFVTHLHNNNHCVIIVSLVTICFKSNWHDRFKWQLVRLSTLCSNLEYTLMIHTSTIAVDWIGCIAYAIVAAKQLKCLSPNLYFNLTSPITLWPAIRFIYWRSGFLFLYAIFLFGDFFFNIESTFFPTKLMISCATFSLVNCRQNEWLELLL